MSRTAAACIAAALLLTAAPNAAASQTPGPAAAETAALWRRMAAIDIDTAYALLNENHPGAEPSLGDREFTERLRRAVAQARERQARITSYAGYAATMNGFAVDMGDKHIWFRPTLRGSYSWTGLTVARRGLAWRVAEDAREGKSGALAGARLVSCDGRDADTVGAERIGQFRAVWTVEAQRIQQAPWILIDDGNPFLTRPRTCVFEKDGAQHSVDLAWTGISGASLTPHVLKGVSIGRAGFGLRPFAGGYWIAMESLDPRAGDVIAAVRAKVDEVRRAPTIVVDMRGNGGGDSNYGVQLASVLLGERYAARAGQTGGDNCPALWRASRGNLEALRDFATNRENGLGDQTREFFRVAAEGVAAAVGRGAPFDGDVRPCAAAEQAAPPPMDLTASAYRGRLYVLTDSACFSSCLLVTSYFRSLGAVHIGEATDAATRYMEVREIQLPSGLGLFSTLQKVAMGSPRQIGPFIPERNFEGDIADTAAVEAWAAALR